MKSSLASNAAQARVIKQRLARPEDQLSYELGKAVQELPPLYTRLLSGTMSALVIGAIAWAHFSQVDEVAAASGQLIASTEVRPVRAIGGGTIQSVKVKEGQHVTKGDILVERDAGLPQAEVDRLTKSFALIRQEMDRLEAERVGGKVAGTQLQDQLLTSRLRDFEARQAAAVSEANSQAAKISEARVRLARLQENLVNARTNLVNAKTNLGNSGLIRDKIQSNLAIAKQREQSFKSLASKENGAVSRLDYLDAQEKLNRANAEITKVGDDVTNSQNKITEADDKVTSLEKDIAAQGEQIRQTEATYQAARSQAQRVASERQSEILTQLTKRREEMATVSGQLEGAKKQRSLESIAAPVSGKIYSIKATRGPVQVGEELLSILPDGEDLLLEVKVLNRDIGFVHTGQRAKVKMAAFPFQEFGTIEGEVMEVSPNSIVDKDLGLVFPARIKLNQRSLELRGKQVEFTPGMSANGEIVTRKKSVLTFIIEPVTRRFSEAFSVR